MNTNSDTSGTETEPFFTVGEAAERTGLSVHTLRYYERAGLMPRVERNGSGGHRRYVAQDLLFLEFLKRLRATGMPIAQMQVYAGLVRQGPETLEARREVLAAHGARVRTQIDELRETLAIIDWKIENHGSLRIEDAADAACEREAAGTVSTKGIIK